LIKYITTYYKGLFGPPQENSVTLDVGRRDDIPQVMEEENRSLVEEFSKEEVKKALFQMEHNKAPGRMSFQLNFIKPSGSKLKVTLWLYFISFIMARFLCTALILVLLFCYRSVPKRKKFSNKGPFAS
jgi:hypothetical protein